MKAPAACNINTLHLNWSPRQITLHAAVHDRRNKTTTTFTARGKAAFVLEHTWDCAWNLEPLPDVVFSPCSWKAKAELLVLKAVSSWLQTPETEVDALYRCLHWAVYPSNSHENPQRPSVPVLYPALTNAALPTNTISLSHTPSI